MMENLFHVMELKVLFAKGHVVTDASLMLVEPIKSKKFLSSSTL